MQQSTWIGLLRLIPPEKHDSLVVVTIIGIEITIQAVFRIEEEYVVLRGRLAGTSDAGRVFFLPYDQINFLAFQKEVAEAQIQDLYGDSGTAGSAAAAALDLVEEVAVAAPAALPAGSSPTPSPSPGQKTPPPDVARPTIQSPLLGKTRLIERLRARAQPGVPGKPAEK